MKTDSSGLKQRAKHELQEYLAISLYVLVFLSALLNYRRVVLAQVGITYAHWGYALVEALVLGKIILIGEALHFGKKVGRVPLIVSAARKSVVFGLFVLIFLVVEHAFHALLRGESLAPELTALLGRPSIAAAHVLLVIVSFIPYFLLRDTGRLFGEERLLHLMLMRGPNQAATAGNPEPTPTSTGTRE